MPPLSCRSGCSTAATRSTSRSACTSCTRGSARPASTVSSRCPEVGCMELGASRQVHACTHAGSLPTSRLKPWLADLGPHSCFARPLRAVLDCSSAGVIINAFKAFMDSKQQHQGQVCAGVRVCACSCTCPPLCTHVRGAAVPAQHQACTSAAHGCVGCMHTLPSRMRAARAGWRGRQPHA